MKKAISLLTALFFFTFSWAQINEKKTVSLSDYCLPEADKNLIPLFNKKVKNKKFPHASVYNFYFSDGTSFKMLGPFVYRHELQGINLVCFYLHH